jgi:hypothetical protein
MKALVAFSLCSVFGCTTTSNVNDGAKIAGTPFTSIGAASMVRTDRGLTNIVLADFVDVCSIADESDQATSETLTLLLADYTAADTSMPPMAPGTYPVSSLTDPLPTSGPYAACGFHIADAACDFSESNCTSGQITLTRADDTGYAGTFDVVIDGDHVTGSFDTMNCANVSEDGSGTCNGAPS